MAMEPSSVIEFTQRGLLLALWVSLPVVLAAAAVGVVVAVVQATTQLQDQTLSQVLKLVAAALVLMLSAHWMGSSIYLFVDDLLRAGGFAAIQPGT
jgi:type III secretion protein S